MTKETGKQQKEVDEKKEQELESYTATLWTIIARPNSTVFEPADLSIKYTTSRQDS